MRKMHETDRYRRLRHGKPAQRPEGVGEGRRSAFISDDPNRMGDADKVILPGVGAFRDAIACLRDAGWAEPIRDHVRQGKPFLGICLGYQLLFTTSYEDGVHQGLGLFAGEVVRFEPTQEGLKIPHMGWESITRAPGSRKPDLARFAGQCLGVLRALVLRSAAGSRHYRSGNGLPDPVRVGDLARQRLRDAVSSGEEPKSRPGDAAKFRDIVKSKYESRKHERMKTRKLDVKQLF